MRLANRRPVEQALAALDIGPGDTVLDLGCGPGDAIALVRLRVPDGTVHGLDHSPVMLEQARRRNRKDVARGRVVLTEGRFTALPYPDGTFDRILAVNVIYFWQDVGAVMSELRRVLRPDGRIAIYATDAAAMRNWRFAATGTHRLFDAGTLADALREADFRNGEFSVKPVACWRIAGLLALVSPEA